MEGQKQEFDMEVTPEREQYMKDLIVRLLAHQHGVDMKDVTVTILSPPADTKEPA